MTPSPSRRRNDEFHESLSIAAPMPVVSAPTPNTVKPSVRLRFGDLLAVAAGVAVTAGILSYVSSGTPQEALDSSTPDTGTLSATIDPSRTNQAKAVLSQSQPKAQDARTFLSYQDARGDYQMASYFATAQQPTVALSDLQGGAGTISGR